MCFIAHCIQRARDIFLSRPHNLSSINFSFIFKRAGVLFLFNSVVFEVLFWLDFCESIISVLVLCTGTICVFLSTVF